MYYVLDIPLKLTSQHLHNSLKSPIIKHLLTKPSNSTFFKDETQKQWHHDYSWKTCMHVQVEIRKYGKKQGYIMRTEIEITGVPSIFCSAVWQASWLANSNGLLHVRTLSHSHFPSMMLQPVTRFSLHGSKPKSWSSSQFSSEWERRQKRLLVKTSQREIHNNTFADQILRFGNEPGLFPRHH